jgi:glycosyltransferase involved in cell wall biosynthesis
MGRAAGVLTTGKRARRFVAHHAGQNKPCMDLPNVPDIEAIRAAAPFRSTAKDQARVIFVGRFIPKKRVSDLVTAFAELPPALRERAQLELVGDGELRQELQSDVSRLRIEDRVRFRGFLQPDEVLKAYRDADVFVMPSSETWGVAPIEAAASGLRVIVSDEVGCAEDLARFTPVSQFPFGDVAALRECLEKQLTEARMNKPLLCGDWTSWSYGALASAAASFLHESCLRSRAATSSRG